MRRIAVILGLCALLFPRAAWADGIPFYQVVVNRFGTANITNAGILSQGSWITGFNGLRAPAGQSLGSVSFSTGALVGGSLLGGGVFSTSGSSFVVTGNGKYGGPAGTIFSGSFFGPAIEWILVRHTGNESLFYLSGEVTGMLSTGRMVSGGTQQIITVNQNQWSRNHSGNLGFGRFQFPQDLRTGPESGTLWLFATGLIAIAGAMRRKLFRA